MEMLADGSKEDVKYDHAFEMIGAELPIPFFKKVGIKLANTWDWKRYLAVFLCFLFVYSLYALKSYGKPLASWPFMGLISESRLPQWHPDAFRHLLLTIQLVVHRRSSSRHA